MSQYLSDSNVTLVYIMELSETIKSVNAVLQTLTSELHIQAVSIHSLKENGERSTSDINSLYGMIRDGTATRPSILQQINDLQYSIDRLQEWCDKEIKESDIKNNDAKTNKAQRHVMYIAIITAIIGAIGQVYSYFAQPAKPEQPIQQKINK